MEYSNGECLQMTGTQNVVDAKSFMKAVISESALNSFVGPKFH